MTPASLKAALAAMPRAVQADIAPALQTVAETVAAEARRSLAASRQKPSAPGEASADLSGELAASLAVIADADGAVLTAASPYAIFLEYGTTRMAARPFLRPAIDATDGESSQLMAAAFAQSVAAALDDLS